MEHDAEKLWTATLDVMRRALARADITATDLAAIGVATQRATVAMWDGATGRALHPAISWQDQRTASRCEELTAQHSFERGWGTTYRMFEDGEDRLHKLRKVFPLMTHPVLRTHGNRVDPDTHGPGHGSRRQGIHGSGVVPSVRQQNDDF